METTLWTPQGHVAIEAKDGAAEGPEFPSVIIPNGDILNLRNLQGGVVDPATGKASNLDIGAGSTANPSNVVFNWDVGKEVRVYNGQKKLVAIFNHSGEIHFYQRVVFHNGTRSV